MSNRQLYSLHSETRKLQCPRCEQKSYKRYRNNETQAYDLPYEIGRCDRENTCAYHVPPSEHFNENPMSFPRVFEPIHEAPKPPSFTDFRLVNQCKANFENKPNVFCQYLAEKFGKRMAIDLIERFHIGTSRHWSGATVFWQISQDQDVHAGKIMLYDTDGRRVRVPYPHVSWVHSAMKTPNYNLKQCLFGLHQLEIEDPEKPIAIVESEKSAILMSATHPEFTWLATGGKDGAKIHECDNLIERNVALFPDLGAEAKWHTYAKLARSKGIHAVVHNWLAHPSDAQIAAGLDPADFITNEEVQAVRREAHLDWCSRIWAGQCARIGEKYPHAQIGDYQDLLEEMDAAAITMDESKFIKAMQIAIVTIENNLITEAA